MGAQPTVIRGQPRLLLFACGAADIAPQEELTIRYGLKGSGAGPVPACHCGAANCSGTLGAVSRGRRKAAQPTQVRRARRPRADRANASADTGTILLDVEGDRGAGLQVCWQCCIAPAFLCCTQRCPCTGAAAAAAEPLPTTGRAYDAAETMLLLSQAPLDAAAPAAAAPPPQVTPLQYTTQAATSPTPPAAAESAPSPLARTPSPVPPLPSPTVSCTVVEPGMVQSSSVLLGCTAPATAIAPTVMLQPWYDHWFACGSLGGQGRVHVMRENGGVP